MEEGANMVVRYRRCILASLTLVFAVCSPIAFGQTVLRLDPGDYILIKRHSFSIPTDDNNKKSGESEFFKNITEQARKQTKLEASRESSISFESSESLGYNEWTIRPIEGINEPSVQPVEVKNK
jgi:hypothetical protein